MPTQQEPLFIDDDGFEIEADDDYEYQPVNLASDGSLTSKWVGCANHNLQLTLKILDKDEKFKKLHKDIKAILTSISRSFHATQALRNSAGLGLVFRGLTR